MATREKYPKLSLRGDRYEIAKTGREPGDRIIEIGTIHIDRSVFKHGSGEKALLKELKLQAKREAMKKE